MIFIVGSYSGDIYLFIKMDVVSHYKHSVTSLSTYPPTIVRRIETLDLKQNVYLAEFSVIHDIPCILYGHLFIQGNLWKD